MVMQVVDEAKDELEGVEKYVLHVGFPLASLLVESSEKHFVLETVYPIFPEALLHEKGYPPFLLDGRLMVQLLVDAKGINARIAKLQSVVESPEAVWVKRVEDIVSSMEETKAAYLQE
jgi:hypothetical protein